MTLSLKIFWFLRESNLSRGFLGAKEIRNWLGCIPHSVRFCEFGPAATWSNRSSSLPFPFWEETPHSERKASTWPCLTEYKFTKPFCAGSIAQRKLLLCSVIVIAFSDVLIHSITFAAIKGFQHFR